MNTYSILKIEGTETWQVLTYFYGSLGSTASIFQDLCKKFSSLNFKIRHLHEKDWPVGIILVEAIFDDPDQAMVAIVNSSCLAIDIDHIFGAICMFDGVFNGYDPLCLSINADQIYSVWNRRVDLNLAINETLRSSNEWKEVVGDFWKNLSRQIAK